MKHRTVASVLMGAALALMVFIGFSANAARADGTWWDGNPAAPPGTVDNNPNPGPSGQFWTPVDLTFTNGGDTAREYRVVVVSTDNFRSWATWHWKRGWADAGRKLHGRLRDHGVLAPGETASFEGVVANGRNSFLVVQSRERGGYSPDWYTWDRRRLPWLNEGFTRLIRGDDTPINGTFDVSAQPAEPTIPEVPLTFETRIAGTKFTAITLTYPSNGASRTASFSVPLVPGTPMVFDLAAAEDNLHNKLLVRDVPFTVRWTNATDAATAPGQVFTFESNVTTHTAELFTVNAAGEMRDHNGMQVTSLIPGAAAAAAKRAGTSTGTFSSGSFSQ